MCGGEWGQSLGEGLKFLTKSFQDRHQWCAATLVHHDISGFIKVTMTNNASNQSLNFSLPDNIIRMAEIWLL